MLLALMACGDSISRVDGAPILKPAPAKLTSVCDEPVVLPDRALKRLEAETLWRKDREALVSCGMTKGAVIAYYVERDKLITSK